MTEEKSLTLVVQEKTLGKLITNAQQIKDAVEKRIEEYSVDNYQGDEKQAAKDKAELNNAAKLLNDERIKLEKEFMSPFNEFKDIVTDTVNLIKQASSKLDVIVKEKEQREKAAKAEQIHEIWDSKKFNLVMLEKVFNQKWLNKTYKLSTVESDIDGIISQIQNDLNALDSFGDDTAQLKDLYLSTLNLQMTLNKGAELKANRERLAAQKAEEEKRKAEEEARAAETKQVVEDLQNITNEIVNEVVEENEKEKAVDTPIMPELPEPKNTANAQKEVYRFNVIGNRAIMATIESLADKCEMQRVESLTLEATTEQIGQFRKLLENNGFVYDKKHFLTLEVN